MKLSRISQDIPSIRDEKDGTYPLEDNEGLEFDIDFNKKFIHRPLQSVAGELNKDMRTPTSPTSFTGAPVSR